MSRLGWPQLLKNPGPTESGQVTLELVVSFSLLSLVLAGAGWLLKLELDRARCAYLVFESAHARLSGRSGPEPRIEIQVSESEASVKAVGRCGSGALTVELPKLESLAREVSGR